MPGPDMVADGLVTASDDITPEHGETPNDAPLREQGNASAATPRGAWRTIGLNAGSRIAVMTLQGALAIVTTRLILEHYGVPAYAQYGLLASLGALVPFADLGLSAAVINAVAGAKDPRTDENLHRTLVAGFRILLSSASVLALVAIGISAAGWWPDLLGEGLLPGGAAAAMVCALLFAFFLPVGVGQRVLTGLGLNHYQVLAQGVAAPFILACVAASVVWGLDLTNWLAVLVYLASGSVAVIALVIAARRLSPQIGRAWRDVPRLRSVKGAAILGVALPMLVQMVALPLAMQTDRLLLSHRAGTTALASYNLGSQMFGMIIQVVVAAGIALWPVFARARSAGEIRSPFGLAGAFAGAGLLVALALALMLPIAVPIIAGDRVHLSGWLVASFVLLVGAQAAKYPLGMYMTDARGLRFQVWPILVLLPLNLGLSWYLIGPLGAAGPVLGSAVSVVLCQVVPNALYVRRDLARRISEERTT